LGNPADDVKAASITTFVPKDRALLPPEIRLALRLILLTLVRKSELIQATWNEVGFENATWTIPKQRMKGFANHWSEALAFSCSCKPARRRR